MKELFLICVVETVFVLAARTQTSIRRSIFLAEFEVDKRHDVSSLFPFIPPNSRRCWPNLYHEILKLNTLAVTMSLIKQE